MRTPSVEPVVARAVQLALALVLLGVPAASAEEYYTKHKGDKRQVEVRDDMALVYVFRPASIGAAIKTWTFADDQLIGLSRAKGFYFAYVPPGKYTVWSKAENTSGLDRELAAGEKYFFKTAIRMGFGKARVKLAQIDEAEAQKYFGKCSFTEPTEAGRQRATEIAANRLERAENNAKMKEARDSG